MRIGTHSNLRLRARLTGEVPSANPAAVETGAIPLWKSATRCRSEDFHTHLRSVSRQTELIVQFGKSHSKPPAPCSNQGPKAFHKAKGPRTLKEAVDRGKDAGYGESQDEPVAAILACVAQHHRGHGEQAECTESVHG